MLGGTLGATGRAVAFAVSCAPPPPPRCLHGSPPFMPGHIRGCPEAPALGATPGSASRRRSDCPRGRMAAEKPRRGFRAASWGSSLGGGTRGLWQGA